MISPAGASRMQRSPQYLQLWDGAPLRDGVARGSKRSLRSLAGRGIHSYHLQRETLLAHPTGRRGFSGHLFFLDSAACTAHSMTCGALSMSGMVIRYGNCQQGGGFVWLGIMRLASWDSSPFSADPYPPWAADRRAGQSLPPPPHQLPTSLFIVLGSGTGLPFTALALLCAPPYYNTSFLGGADFSANHPSTTPSLLPRLPRRTVSATTLRFPTTRAPAPRGTPRRLRPGGMREHWWEEGGIRWRTAAEYDTLVPWRSTEQLCTRATVDDVGGRFTNPPGPL